MYSSKTQFLVATDSKYFFFDPLGTFVGVTSITPSPYHLEDLGAHKFEGFSTYDMTIVVGPTSNNRI